MSNFFTCGSVKLHDNIYDDFFLPQNTNSSFKSAFTFMLNLLWESRFRLPLMVLVGLILFDIRLQFELNGQDLMEQLRNENYDSEDDDDEFDDSSDEVDEDEDDESEEDADLIGNNINELYISELREFLYENSNQEVNYRSRIFHLISQLRNHHSYAYQEEARELEFHNPVYGLERNESPFNTS